MDPGGGPQQPQPQPLPPLVFQSFQSASVVIGQPDFVSSAVNQGGGASANTLFTPRGLTVTPDGILFNADAQNHRVLAFRVPEQVNAAAQYVIGQADFVSTVSSAGRHRLAGPTGVDVNGGRMVVADKANSRILLYRQVPSSTGALPDGVLGQVDFNQRVAGCGLGSLNQPESAVLTADGKVVVADTLNHRVLIWTAFPERDGQGPDLIIGQSGGDRCASNDDDQDGSSPGLPPPTARVLKDPSAVWTDGRRLVVVDRSNHRVLIWNSFPTTTFQPADVVLGQSDFSRQDGNDDDQDGGTDAVTSARVFLLPVAVVGFDSGRQLAVADGLNGRILIWKTFPTVNFQPADVVLGQSNFGKRTENDDDQDGAMDAAPTARTFRYASAIAAFDDKLIVSDTFNRRVLIFKGRR